MGVGEDSEAAPEAGGLAEAGAGMGAGMGRALGDTGSGGTWNIGHWLQFKNPAPFLTN